MATEKRRPAFLGLGGNLGSPASSMAQALKALNSRTDTRVTQVSALYRTPPWGKIDQPDFLNAVAEIHTSLSPRELLDTCLAIEQSLKRERAERWGPRVIDIDILVYDNEILDEEDLQLPHPRMAQRAFVLIPLSELAPNLAVNDTPIAQTLTRLDASGIAKISDDGSWWQHRE